MSTLYTGLAEVYEAMYQTFMQYDEEFEFYAGILKRHGCGETLEIGCGAGNLASRFRQAGVSYNGMDMSADMLKIARQNNPGCTFYEGDMRNFVLPQPMESVLLAGRTISYLISNQDVCGAFAAIRKSLKPGGVLCFDAIDALRFIPVIREGEKITHRAEWKGRQYFRDSFWRRNISTNWLFDWHSIYYETTGGAPVEIGSDHSTIRTFTKDEMRIFLTISGFEVLEIMDRSSYAFETFVAVARKRAAKSRFGGAAEPAELEFGNTKFNQP